MATIGTLHESPLHASLKQLLSLPGDRFEVPLEGYIIDLVRSSGELVEVQTRGFRPLRPKLERLLDFHPMRVVHPIAVERVLVKLGEDGQTLSRRRAPRPRASPRVHHMDSRFLLVFEHLVSFPTLLTHPNFTLEVILCREEVRQRQKHLVEVVDRWEIRSVEQLQWMIPGEPFTTRQLADHLGCPLELAQRITYCLRCLDQVEEVGKRGRAPLYEKSKSAS